jgi:hypothetical protein
MKKILEILIRILKALIPKKKKKKVRFSSEPLRRKESDSSIDEELEKINKRHEQYYGERGPIPIKISK